MNFFIKKHTRFIRNCIFSTKCYFMRLFYGYDLVDIYNLDFCIGKKIVYLLEHFYKNNPSGKNEETYSKAADLIFLYSYVFDLDDTIYASFYEHNLGKMSFDDYMELMYKEKAIEIVDVLSKKDLKELIKFSHKVLSKWLKEGVKVPPRDETLDSWVKKLTNLNLKLKETLQKDELKMSTLKELISLLPKMVD